MSKKSFTGGLGSLLGDQPEPIQKETVNTVQTPTRGRPTTNFKEIKSQSQKGTKEGETRATIIINEEMLDKIKALAYWDRTTIKEIITTAIEESLAKYEKENGVIKPFPDTYIRNVKKPKPRD